MSQPKPKHQYGKPATWALVQGDLLARGEYTILSDVGLRNQMGIQKYGTPLQPGNGRDSIRDAHEEAMDLTVYLQNAIQELPPVVPPGKDFRTLTRLYHQAMGIMCALRDYQDDREAIRQEREELEGSVVIHPHQPEADDFQKAREAFQEVKYRKADKMWPQEVPVDEYYRAVAESQKPLDESQDAPGEAIPTAWGDVPSQTHEAHTGHPVASGDGHDVDIERIVPAAWESFNELTSRPGWKDDFHGITVEVANQMPTIFIPDQVQGKAREDLLEWKANMEVSLQAERDRYRKTQEERAKAGATSPVDLM